MNEKNLALINKIMDAITGDGRGEWDAIMMHDSAIAAANDHVDALLERVETLLPDGLYGELADACSSGLCSVADTGIPFGIHVADVTRDVASRPTDLSRHILKRIEGRATI